MTLTLSDLTEWRRQEKDHYRIIVPPDQKDIRALLDQLLKDAGPDPLQLGEDCDYFTARELLEDIFRLRRDKLARAAELNATDIAPPDWGSLTPFEKEIWFSLTEAYRRLDYAIGEVVRKGEWSGKWMPDKPNQGAR